MLSPQHDRTRSSGSLRLGARADDCRREYLPLRHTGETLMEFPRSREYRFVLLDRQVLASAFYWEGIDPFASSGPGDPPASLAVHAAERLDARLLAVDIGQLEDTSRRRTAHCSRPHRPPPVLDDPPRTALLTAADCSPGRPPRFDHPDALDRVVSPVGQSVSRRLVGAGIDREEQSGLTGTEPVESRGLGVRPRCRSIVVVARSLRRRSRPAHRPARRGAQWRVIVGTRPSRFSPLAVRGS
jgi:hypothetical protein